jgi:hypothetical protein
MNLAIEKLRKSQWVHLFAEGKVNQKGWMLEPLKWGMCRLIVESSVVDVARNTVLYSPDIIPIVHLGMWGVGWVGVWIEVCCIVLTLSHYVGMEKILPLQTKGYILSFHNSGIRIAIGEPFKVDDILLHYASQNPPPPSLLTTHTNSLDEIWKKNTHTNVNDNYQHIHLLDRPLFHQICMRIEEKTYSVEDRIRSICY